MTTDREAITDLLYNYAERIDAGDFAGIAALFADAEISYEGYEEKRRGSVEVLDSYVTSTRRYDDGTPKTKHLMTNVIVEVDDAAASATSRSYFTVLQAVAGEFLLQPVIAGRYHCHFVRGQKDWSFASMHIIVELFGDLSHHLLFNLSKDP